MGKRIDKNTFKTVSIKCHRDPVAVGYVCIPAGVDRDLFVAKCLRTCRISVYTDNGDYMDRVPVSNEIISSIEFPASATELGSAVLFVVLPNKNKPVVLCSLLSHEESNVLREGEFYIEKKTENGVARIGGSTEDGIVNIISNFKDVSKVNVVSFSDDAEINFSTNGTFNVVADKTIALSSYSGVDIVIKNVATGNSSTISYVSGSGFTYSDEFGNKIEANAAGTVVTSDKISIGSSTSAEAIVLGTSFNAEILKTQALLTALKNAITAAVPVPGDGGLAIKTTIVSAISALPVGSFSNILSTKSFTE